MTPFALVPDAPFPVAITPAVLPEALYWDAQGSWPTLTAHHLEPGDPAFAPAAARDPWPQVFEHLNGPALATQLMALFQPFLGPSGLPGAWTLSDYHEPRETRHGVASLADTRPVGELYTRTHWQDGVSGYAKAKHLDWPRRVYSCMVYCCDADEEGLAGGGTAMYRRDGSVWRTFQPRHNLAVCWLNTPNAWHAGESVTACRGSRRWLFHVLSSTQDLWSR
jgi:hypothetical protein